MADFYGKENLLAFKGARVFSGLDPNHPQMNWVCIPVPYNDIELTADGRFANVGVRMTETNDKYRQACITRRQMAGDSIEDYTPPPTWWRWLSPRSSARRPWRPHESVSSRKRRNGETTPTSRTRSITRNCVMQSTMPCACGSGLSMHASDSRRPCRRLHPWQQDRPRHGRRHPLTPSPDSPCSPAITPAMMISPSKTFIPLPFHGSPKTQKI